MTKTRLLYTLWMVFLALFAAALGDVVFCIATSGEIAAEAHGN